MPNDMLTVVSFMRILPDDIPNALETSGAISV